MEKELINRLLAAIVFIVIAIMVRGILLVKLWSLLIVPIFKVNDITLAAGIGVTFLSLFVFRNLDFKEESDDEIEKATTVSYIVNKLGYLLLNNFVILLMGYIISLYL